MKYSLYLMVLAELCWASPAHALNIFSDNDDFAWLAGAEEANRMVPYCF